MRRAIERLQNKLVQLRETLSGRSANRQDTVEAWQKRYEQKLGEQQESQQFEGRYLSHEYVRKRKPGQIASEVGGVGVASAS